MITDSSIKRKKKQKSSINLVRKEYILFFLLVSSIVFVFKTSQVINELSPYIPISDELYNIHFAVSIEEIGLPYWQMSESSPNYTEGFPYRFCNEYVVESYMRFPFYLAAKHLDFNWGVASNLFYYFLLILIALLLILKWKKWRRFSPLIFIFFLLLIGSSTWAKAAYHYNRYFAFLMLGTVVCHFLSIYFYTYFREKPLIKIFLVLSIAFIPSLFHKLAYLYLLSWIIIIGVEQIILLIKENNRRQFLQTGVGAIIIASIVFFTFYRRIKGALKRIDVDAYVPSIKNFIDLSFGIEPLSILILLAVIIMGVLGIKKLTKFERHFLWKGLLIVLISLMLLPLVMGSNYTNYNGANRYYFFIHVMILLVIAVLMTSAYYFLLVKTPKFPYKPIGIYLIFCFTVVTGIFSMTHLPLDVYSFSLLPKMSKSNIDEVYNQVKDKDCVVVTNLTSYFAEYFFPGKPNYLFNGFYPSVLKDAPNNTRKEGWVKYDNKIYRYNGIVDVGTVDSFCSMLDEHPNKSVFFFAINLSRQEPELIKRLKTIQGFKGGIILPVSSLQEAVCN